MLRLFLLCYLGFLVSSNIYMLIISINNAIYFKRKSKFWKNCYDVEPLVSVLVPARNEEKNIEKCVLSLLNQNYANYELLVYDDNSSDGTYGILTQLASKHKKLQIIKGENLEQGWKGKSYGLHQLAILAKGEYLVCVDADMEAKPDLISWAIVNMLHHKCDSLSAWPKHNLASFLHYFVVPTIYIATGFLFPVNWIKSTSNPLFSHAIGQIMAFKKSSYEGAGGYQAIKEKINEDINMARVMKAKNYSHIFLDATAYLEGDMYDSFKKGIDGITRTLYEYFDWKIYPIFILTFYLFFCIVLPPFLAIGLIFYSGLLWAHFMLASFLFYLAWSIICYNRKLKWFTPIFMPIQFFIIIICGWRSIALKRRGYLWKGRYVGSV